MKKLMPYHRLSVYQKSYQLALEVHQLSRHFPTHEQYELARQLRAVSKSIVANIVEGMSKQESYAETRRFVRIAMGSCEETRLWIKFSKDLNYITLEVQEIFDNRYEEIGKMLRGIEKRYNELINQVKKSFSSP